MATTVENHTHSCQYSEDGSTWLDFSSYVESFTTHHGYQSDRGTCSINCYAYPSGLANNDYVVCYIDGVMVFNGRMARPALHGHSNSVVIECEGRGANLANPWGGEGTDPELDDLMNRVYESQTTRAIITNLCEAMAVEVNMHDILGDNETRGTILPVTVRVGQTPWSIIRGESGLDEIRGSWTAETKNGAITRRYVENAVSADFDAIEGDNIISCDRTPQGTESIVNRCIVYGFEYEGATFGGLGVGDYYQANSNIPDPPKSRTRVIRNSYVESDAEALAMATAWVDRHNFPYDETNIVLLGNTSIDIGQTVEITSTEWDHAGDLRFIADVSHRYGVGVGYETQVKAIRVTVA
jgi:hypothetical protein